MKNKGWVKLWRDQFNNWVSDRKPWCDGYAWCYLYSRANHKKRIVNFRNQYIEVERGQLLTSKLKLQRIFGWSYKRTTAYLKALEKDKMCTIRTTNRYIIITIVNYDLYQSKEEQGIEQKGEQRVEQEKNRSRTGQHKQECIKNVNNIHIKKKKNYFSEELPESNTIDLRKELGI